MQNFYEFCGQHSFLALLFVLAGAYALEQTYIFLFKIWDAFLDTFKK